MAYQKQVKINPALIVKKIEEEKEGRSKNIYYFTLSMSMEQEKNFNKKLKELINSINDHLAIIDNIKEDDIEDE